MWQNAADVNSSGQQGQRQLIQTDFIPHVSAHRPSAAGRVILSWTTKHKISMSRSLLKASGIHHSHSNQTTWIHVTPVRQTHNTGVPRVDNMPWHLTDETRQDHRVIRWGGGHSTYVSIGAPPSSGLLQRKQTDAMCLYKNMLLLIWGVAVWHSYDILFNITKINDRETSLLPENSGCPTCISTRIQPRLHISIAMS